MTPRDPSHKRYLIGLISCLLPIPDLRHPVFEKMLLRYSRPYDRKRL